MLSFLPLAIIEHVRDGSVVRALLLPDYYLVTVMLSGIKVTTIICCTYNYMLHSVVLFDFFCNLNNLVSAVFARILK